MSLRQRTKANWRLQGDRKCLASCHIQMLCDPSPQPARLQSHNDHSMHHSASSRVLRTVRGPDVFVHKALSKRGCFVGSILPAQHLAATHGPWSGVGLPPELRQHGPHAARLRVWPLSQIRLVRCLSSHCLSCPGFDRPRDGMVVALSILGRCLWILSVDIIN